MTGRGGDGSPLAGATGTGATTATPAAASGGGPSPYRGPDRRPLPPEPPDEVAWTRAGLVLVAATGLGTVLTLQEGVRRTVLPLTTHFRVATVALAAVLAVASYAAARVTGEVRGVRVATAAWLLAGVTLLDLTGAPPGSTLDALRWSTSAIAAGWVLWATVGPDIDTRVRAPRDLATATAALVALASVLAAALAVGPMSPASATVVVASMVSLAWGVAVVTTARITRRARSYLSWWAVWAVGGIAFADAARAVGRAGLVADLPSAAVRVGALLLATLGTVAAVSSAATGRRSELHRAMLTVRRRDEDRRSVEAEQAHEVRNALLAVEGATHILQRYRGELPADVEAELTTTIAEQLATLREMLVRHRDPPTGGSGDPTTAAEPPTTTTALAQVVRDQVSLARARGLAVELELGALPTLPPRIDLDAVRGVVNNLLRNAEVHGQGGEDHTIEVELIGDEHQVRLSIRDHGPGVPVQHADAIFTRGGRLDPGAPGEGLGLFLARRNMRAMGGDLRLERPVGGGARFVASLPAATVAPAAGQPPVAGPDPAALTGQRAARGPSL
jgi:signal transduction histidine kinase